MRISDPNLRELLAAEHVLGMHTVRVRSRFARLAREDSRLRNTIEEWEARFHPLVAVLPEVQPPARVWKAIQKRIARPVERTSRALSFWRSLALLSTAAAMALLVYIGVARGPDASPYMVSVMSTPEAQPMMVATWQDEDEGELKIQILAKHVMTADTSWELWCLPGNNRPPVSLGLITTDAVQTVELNEKEMRELAKAEALAMSVEPKGGSPTGLPTGPVLASGPLRKI